MADERIAQESPRVSESTTKRPWHPPQIQAVDVLETETGSGAYTFSDFTTYGS